MNQLDFKDRTAIVTGGAQGIGFAIVKRLAASGAKVRIWDVDGKLLAKSIAGLSSAVTGDTIDVADAAAVERGVKSSLEVFGRIDVLVNNAGITAFVDFPDLEGLSEEIWDRLFSVNVKGTFFCCRAVAAPMRTQGHGRIINIASVAGIWAQGSSMAYSASKAAVIHLSKCLARTLGPEILVNVIAPGFIVDTRWNVGRPNLEATTSKAAQAAPLKRAGKPEDIADAALFLATRGDFVTGDVLVVDGGRVLT